MGVSSTFWKNWYFRSGVGVNVDFDFGGDDFGDDDDDDETLLASEEAAAVEKYLLGLVLL